MKHLDTHKPGLTHLTLALLFAGLLVVAPRTSHAQVITSDPTNLVQNTTSAAAEVESTIQQIKEVYLQTQQLKAQLMHLKQLDLGNIEGLKDALLQASAMIDETRHVAAAWGVIASDIGETYGLCGEPATFIEEPDDYWELKASWSCGTDYAIEASLGSQARGAEYLANVQVGANVLGDRIDLVEGSLQASTLGNKFLHMLVGQLTALTNQGLHASNVEMMGKLEERKTRQAARRAHLGRLAGGFRDRLAEQHMPVALEDF